jgi:phage-related protein
MDYFSIGGVSSSSFNAYIYDSNAFDSPSRSVDTYDVPGRNGTLTIAGSEKFVNRELWYDMYIPKSMISNVRGLSNYLHSLNGYQRIEDTFEPDVYKKAMYLEAMQLSVKTETQAVFRLTFDCQPEKWLKNGEQKTVFTKTGSINNPTVQTAKPLIRIYGKGIVQIGKQTIEILKAPTEYIDVDCDIQDCFEGTANRNSYVSLTDFPTLVPGTNGITLGAGITKVEITPRWWTL